MCPKLATTNMRFSWGSKLLNLRGKRNSPGAAAPNRFRYYLFFALWSMLPKATTVAACGSNDYIDE